MGYGKLTAYPMAESKAAYREYPLDLDQARALFVLFLPLKWAERIGEWERLLAARRSSSRLIVVGSGECAKEDESPVDRVSYVTHRICEFIMKPHKFADRKLVFDDDDVHRIVSTIESMLEEDEEMVLTESQKNVYEYLKLGLTLHGR